MEQKFTFQITPLDPAATRSQVSRALEKRSELLSRRKYPRIWRITDRLGQVEKAPPEVLRRRRKLYLVLGLTDWVLGLFLLLPGLMAPGELPVPLLVGGVCFGFSMGILWRRARHLLGILSTVLGGLLCFGALGSWSQLGRFLPLGILCGAVGFAALRPRKQPKASAFDRAADSLLARRSSLAGAEDVRVVFSHQGMTIRRGDDDRQSRSFSYSDFELVLETEDLLLPICDESVMVLQKKDLLDGAPSELAEFLRRQVWYVLVQDPAKAGP